MTAAGRHTNTTGLAHNGRYRVGIIRLWLSRNMPHPTAHERAYSRAARLRVNRLAATREWIRPQSANADLTLMANGRSWISRHGVVRDL
jgi:hypothetical protein